MLDIGFQELIVVMVIALLVFGPYKLPELGRALGRAMREFRRASEEFRSTIETNLNLTEDPLASPASTESLSPSPSPVAAGEPAPPPAGSAGESPGAAGSTGSPEASGGEGSAAAGSMLRAELVDPFCGPRGGRLLHRSTCAWVTRIPEWDRIVFKTAAEGLELGRIRCPVCEPLDAEATS